MSFAAIPLWGGGCGIFAALERLRGVKVHATLVKMQSYCSVDSKDQCTRMGASAELIGNQFTRRTPKIIHIAPLKGICSEGNNILIN